MAPRDPILGITEAFNADKNANKVNLGVGVYYDDNGKVPLLECVKKAEAQLMEKATPRTYLPIEGLAAYDKAVQELVFGAESAVIREKLAVTAQALGGTGALKLGADHLVIIPLDLRPVHAGGTGIRTGREGLTTFAMERSIAQPRESRPGSFAPQTAKEAGIEWRRK